MSTFSRLVLPAFCLALPLLGGCAGDGCKYLAYESLPESAPPLVMPAGVPAPPESAEFRVPEGKAEAITGRCSARPPMTLPPEVLVDPEDGEEAVEEPTTAGD